MTNREKFLSVMNYKSNAQMPIVHFGYWDETLEKWALEGHISKNDVSYDGWEAVSKKLGFDYGFDDCYMGSTGLHPGFEPKVIKEFADGAKHILTDEGVIELQKPGVTSIPVEIDHILKDRKTWEENYLPKLQFSADRYDFNWLKKYAGSDNPKGLYAGSLYGVIRNWFGIVGLSYIAADDEELYEEVIDTVGNLAYEIVKFGLEKAAEMGIAFDFLAFWEDICFKTGPLVNPKVFGELVGPYYKKITDLAKAHGISIFPLDCDGLIDELVPIWYENGVNTMFPIEVGTWGGSIAPWRKLYGQGLLGIGGMDKRVFAKDKKAVDEEIERLKPLVDLGGFIPCPDHRIAPDAKYDLVCYYCEKMRKAFT